MIYPISAWKDLLKFNAYMLKSDLKNSIPKKEKKNNNVDPTINIQVDLHVNRPEEKKPEDTSEKFDDSNVIDVEAEELKDIKEETDQKEGMLNFNNIEKEVTTGPDFSNAENVVINDPIPGVTYEKEELLKGELHEVTEEDVEEAIKNSKSTKKNK